MRDRYILFAYEGYYPCGGSEDVIARSDSLEVLTTIKEATSHDYYEVLDLDTGDWISI